MPPTQEGNISAIRIILHRGHARLRQEDYTLPEKTTLDAFSIKEKRALTSTEPLKYRYWFYSEIRHSASCSIQSKECILFPRSKKLRR